MQSFSYKKIENIEQVFGFFQNQPKFSTRFLAGGTTLIDLMKLDVERPKLVLDINALPFNKIERTQEGGMHIGALVRNSDLAHDKEIATHYTVLSQALLSGASAQLRNKATTSGNLLQRTRCVYFREESKACNKRKPGSGCAAIDGMNRNLAILGTSKNCIATNPSDMNVAMMALEAKIQLLSKATPRTVAIEDFYLLPGSTPDQESVLKSDELITGVMLAPLPKSTKSLYLKLRDRASYEFALASAAVVITQKDGLIERARIAMGGIGTRPWRSLEAEKILEGKSASETQFKAAAEEFLRGAQPQSQNAFKIELAKRCLIYALKKVTSKEA